jgi:hypothetical protein
VVSLLYHAAAAFLQYGQGVNGNGPAYYFASAVNAVLASIGLWCFLFATDRGHISRRVIDLTSNMADTRQTGADKVLTLSRLMTDMKRTSGFPFKNVEADKRK